MVKTRQVDWDGAEKDTWCDFTHTHTHTISCLSHTPSCVCKCVAKGPECPSQMRAQQDWGGGGAQGTGG